MEQMISTLGFPMACATGMAGFLAFIIKYLLDRDKQNREDTSKLIENLREDNKLDREVYKDTIDKFDCKLDKFAVALESSNIRLETIEDDIKTIKTKVGE